MSVSLSQQVRLASPTAYPSAGTLRFFRCGYASRACEAGPPLQNRRLPARGTPDSDRSRRLHCAPLSAASEPHRWLTASFRCASPPDQSETGGSDALLSWRVLGTRAAPTPPAAPAARIWFGSGLFIAPPTVFAPPSSPARCRQGATSWRCPP